MKNNFELYDSIKGMLAANKPEPKKINGLSEDSLAAYAKKRVGSTIAGVEFGQIAESKEEVPVEEVKSEVVETEKETETEEVTTEAEENSEEAPIIEGIFSEDEIAALLEMEQLDEISAKTLQSYSQKNKADPKRVKTRGPTSKTQKAHIEKRDAGLAKARAKLDKHYDAEDKKAEANHKEVINHVHENMHDALSHHGYKHIGGDDNHVLYAKHLKGTSVMNHAIVHKPKGDHPSHNEHVLTLKSTTGWQNSSNDRHRVAENAHGHGFRTLNTKHDAMTHLHNSIKAHDDYHAEKAKDHWLYK